jgi:hypothetical protein
VLDTAQGKLLQENALDMAKLAPAFVTAGQLRDGHQMAAAGDPRQNAHGTARSISEQRTATNTVDDTTRDGNAASIVDRYFEGGCANMNPGVNEADGVNETISFF